MKTYITLALLLTVCTSTVMQAQGPFGRIISRIQTTRSTWNGGYSDPAWGQPHVLVVPPTAEMQTKYSWGVANTQVRPIYPQFGRSTMGLYDGPGYPMPAQPSHTDQFGTYYVRGPW